jgi:hypothetical protein
MQNYAHLIEKLQTAFASNASAEELYVISTELQQNLYQSLSIPAVTCGSKVSVVLPNSYLPRAINSVIEEGDNVEIAVTQPTVNVPFSANKLKSEMDIVVEKKEKPAMVLVAADNDDDDGNDVITFMAIKKSTEVAASIPNKGVLLFNDVDTDSEKFETSRFVETKITDLKKTISLHEKFVFIKELFRGDDSNYDRSINTIQNFNDYTEAKNWIVKELFTKEGWKDENETVQSFMDLVKRRFL